MRRHTATRVTVAILIAALGALTPLAVSAFAKSRSVGHQAIGKRHRWHPACEVKARHTARTIACGHRALVLHARQLSQDHQRSHKPSKPPLRSEPLQPLGSEPAPEPAPETAPALQPEPTPTPEPSRDHNCFSQPSACGYPDTTNTGATGTLTPSGSITASTNGQIIEGKNVTGQITVEANNVTIRNVRITTTATGSGSAAIWVRNGHTGTRVINSTISGKGSGSQTVEAAIRSYSGVTVEGDVLTLCNECVQGWPLTVKDSYMKVSSIYAGAHVEDIYICSGTVNVDHSTLINEQGQTATVFGDTICGGGNHFTVTNSLLAGGGFLLYPQANNSNPAGAQTTITGNHLARCTSPETYEPSSGGHPCRNGPDSNGYFPNGGNFGIGAYFAGPTTWSGNVWDDNLAPISEP